MASRKGRPNKEAPKIIREMIKAALARVGGTDYLAEQAIQNPVAFMGLIAKLVPAEVTTTLELGQSFFDKRAKEIEARVADEARAKQLEHKTSYTVIEAERVKVAVE